MIIRFSIKKGVRCRNRGIDFCFALSGVRILIVQGALKMGKDVKEQEMISFLEGAVGRDNVSVCIYEKIKQSVDAFPYHA